MANSYAIVESGGKQYRAEKGTTCSSTSLPADEGGKVNLRAVMFRGDKDVVLDGGQLEKVKVEAVVDRAPARPEDPDLQVQGRRRATAGAAVIARASPGSR